MKKRKIITNICFTLLTLAPLSLFSCAQVEAQETFFEVNVYSSSGGTVEGFKNGKYKEGSEITLVAKAESSYKFVGFFENDALVSEDNNYSFKVTRNITLTVEFEKEEIKEDPIDTPSEDSRIEKFSHIFKKEELSGEKNIINGVEFSCEKPTYASQVQGKGIQIGSKNNPQLVPLNLTFNFNENVKLLNVSINLATATDGKGTVSLLAANNSSLIINSTQNKNYSFTSINEELSTFVVQISSDVNKAIYFYSIEFDVEVENESNLKLDTDTLIGEQVKPGENGIPELKYDLASFNKETYYASLDLNLSGHNLRENIYSITSKMTQYSYDDCKYTLCYIDENPAKPGYLYGIYDGDDIIAKRDTSWNREHVWPCAHMNITGQARPESSTKNHSTDLFNLRASCQIVNSYHSDKYYDNSNSKDTFYPIVDSTQINGVHNFTGDFRGDVARTIFYMYTRYLELDIIEDVENDTTVTSIGRLSVLKKWNVIDPVDEFEIQRNNRVYEYQGNRNPFIDFPDLSNKLFN